MSQKTRISLCFFWLYPAPLKKCGSVIFSLLLSALKAVEGGSVWPQPATWEEGLLPCRLPARGASRGHEESQAFPPHRPQTEASSLVESVVADVPVSGFYWHRKQTSESAVCDAVGCSRCRSDPISSCPDLFSVAWHMVEGNSFCGIR